MSQGNENVGIVYKVTNKINNKIYIGKTTKTLKTRWGEHLYNVKKECKFYFHNAIRKYGPENFIVDIISESNSKEELGNIEKQMIIFHKSHMSENGYNMTWGGDGTCGWKHSEETKQKIRNGNIGKISWIKGKTQTEESNEKRKLARLGYKTSNETKEKQRQKKLGIKQSDKHIKSRVEGRKGYKPTEETKRKMSESSLGSKNHNYGKKMSEETRKKMSESRKGIIRGSYKNKYVGGC